MNSRSSRRYKRSESHVVPSQSSQSGSIQRQLSPAILKSYIQSQSSSSLEGYWLGPYPIYSEIARGGMGVVYKSHHGALKLDIAIKILLPGDNEARADGRFHREARVLADLTHPNIVALRDYGAHGGLPFLAMDLIRGRTLTNTLLVHFKKEQEFPPPSIVIEMLTPIAEALIYCHENGIVHRDMKPSNIIIEKRSGRPYLVDFGIVKRIEDKKQSYDLTGDGEIVGSPAFLSPEQVDGERFGGISQATDVWSFAATLRYSLSGEYTHPINNMAQFLMDLTSKAPTRIRKLNPKIPRWLDQLIFEGLQLEPDKRPTMEEFLIRLRTGQEGGRSAWKWGVAALSMLALLIPIIWMNSGANKEEIDSPKKESSKKTVLAAPKIEPKAKPKPKPIEAKKLPPKLEPKKTGLVSLKTVLEELADPLSISLQADPKYKALTRSSVYVQPGDLGWSAGTRSDSGNVLRTETLNGQESHVLFEAKQPGCLTRIWLQSPKGKLSIFIDGQSAPAQEIDFDKRLVLPAIDPRFVQRNGSSWTLLFPYPFQKSCQVVSSKKDLRYVIESRAFSENTRVESFNLEQLKSVKELANLAGEALIGNLPKVIAGRQTKTYVLPRKLNTKLFLFKSKESKGAVITELSMTVKGLTNPAELRELILEIEFDGVRTVRAPLGDFFGAPFLRERVKGRYFSSNGKRKLTCTFPMPFHYQALISIHNYGEKKVRISASAQAKRIFWSKRSMIFHCKSKGYPHVRIDRPYDRMLFRFQGSGRYIGTFAQIHSPLYKFWGSGDARFHVDQSPFPTLVTTDARAWFGLPGRVANPSTLCFSSSLTGMPKAPPRQWAGITSVYRLRVLDAIPFEKELKILYEEAALTSTMRRAYTFTSYWYAPVGDSKESTIDLAQMKRPSFKNLVWKENSVIEAEQMNVGVSGGTAFIYGPKKGLKVSGGHLLCWSINDVGAKLGMTIPKVKDRRKQSLGLRVLRGPNLGRFDIVVNGQKVSTYDLYRPQESFIDLTLPNLDFSQDTKLKFVLVGFNEKRVANRVERAPELLIDYLKLTPVIQRRR